MLCVCRLVSGDYQMLGLSCWRGNCLTLSWKSSPFSTHPLMSVAHTLKMHLDIHYAHYFNYQGSRSSLSAVQTATPASLSGFRFSFDQPHCRFQHTCTHTQTHTHTHPCTHTFTRTLMSLVCYIQMTGRHQRDGESLSCYHPHS